MFRGLQGKKPQNSQSKWPTRTHEVLGEKENKTQNVIRFIYGKKKRKKKGRQIWGFDNLTFNCSWRKIIICSRQSSEQETILQSWSIISINYVSIFILLLLQGKCNYDGSWGWS